jgi:hypothetical protein
LQDEIQKELADELQAMRTEMQQDISELAELLKPRFQCESASFALATLLICECFPQLRYVPKSARVK